MNSRQYYYVCIVAVIAKMLTNGGVAEYQSSHGRCAITAWMSFIGKAIAKSQGSGSAEALAILPVLQEILSEAQQALAQVQTRLEETSDTYQAIAESEAKRIAFERLRLEKRIAEIRQQCGDSEQAQELIKLEEENSAIAESNINREAYNRDLSYEQELLNINSGIKNRKAEFTRADGFELEANQIQRENAIAFKSYQHRFVMLFSARAMVAD